MTGAENVDSSPSKPPLSRGSLLVLLSAVAVAAVGVCFHLSRRLAEARAAGVALAARFELAERGNAAVEAIRGDLESAQEMWKDDEAGRAWLSRCAFPVDATPAGGTALPLDGRCTIVLLARPGLFTDSSRPTPSTCPTVRVVAWFTAESTEVPALVSWESEPLVSSAWLSSLPPQDRREAVESLVRGGVRFAWSPAAAGPRSLDVLSGDVVPEEGGPVVLTGSVKRWCGDGSGAPVLARGLGYPAFYVLLPGARRMEIHLTLELKVEGQEPLRRSLVAIAAGR